jgi:hypothetical protein
MLYKKLLRRSFLMKIALSVCLTLVFLVFAALPSHAALDKKGLLLLFAFENVKGDTVPDLSGGKHDGILKTNAKITTTAKYGKGALEITDQNAVMEVISFKELEEYQDNSYLFWIYFSAGSNGAWSQILAKLGGTDRSPGVWINPGSTGIHYRYDPGNQGCDQIGPNGEGTFHDLKTWYHVAGVKKGAELSFYSNGVEKRKVGVPKSHVQSAQSLFVGKSPSYRAATFIMDDLVLFNRALTADEVKLVMDGALTDKAPVESLDKLASTWGDIKRDAR